MDLRRSNFTSASAKKANFMNSNLQGAYFMKSVSGEARVKLGHWGGHCHWGHWRGVACRMCMPPGASCSSSTSRSLLSGQSVVPAGNRLFMHVVNHGPVPLICPGTTTRWCTRPTLRTQTSGEGGG